MCVGYLTYYPRRNFPFCVQAGDVDFCETDGEVTNGARSRGCDVYNFMMGMTLWNIVNDVSNSRACQSNGCSSECLRKMQCTYYQRHACLGYSDLRHVVSEYLKEYYDPTDRTAPAYRMFGQKLESCQKAAMTSSPVRCNVMGGWGLPYGRRWTWGCNLISFDLASIFKDLGRLAYMSCLQLFTKVLKSIISHR